MLSEMKHLHECFTLLRSCASACKMTHLMRAVPLQQLTKFLDGFDALLKKAMEKLLRHDLKAHQWRPAICELDMGVLGSGVVSSQLALSTL